MSNVRSFRGAGAACEPGTHAHGPTITVGGPVFIGSGPGPLGHPGMTFMTGALAGLTYNRFGSGADGRAPAMAAIIFANCAMLDGTRKERREDHHVLVEDRNIREVSDRPISSATAETIDLHGRTLMPGLIDAHVHVLAVDAALARLSDRPVTLLTLQAAKVLEGMLQRGFTTIRDAGGADGGLAEAVEDGLVRGPRIFPSGSALSQTGRHLRLLRRGSRALAHRRRCYRMPPCGA